MTRRSTAGISAILLAPLCLLAQTSDPSEVLERALAKLEGTSRRLLQFTCLQTIDRSYYSAPAGRSISLLPTEARSCAGRQFSKATDLLTLDSQDRLRLQVAFADNKEISSWAAASRFDSRAVTELVSTGAISTGAFGGALMDIFENPGAHYTFIGSIDEGARKLLEFSFEVPLLASNWFIVRPIETVTAYHGTFAIDQATAELVRVTSETDELTPDTHMCRVRTANDYHYVTIGDGRYLIPSQAELDTVTPTGAETRNINTFSSCHEYRAESTVSFGEELAAAGGETAKQAAPAPLPAGLSLTLALTDRIELATAAAGDAISAKVTKAVRAPRSNEVLIAAGAIAHGRILNLMHLYNPAEYKYSVLFESLEQNGSITPLSIELESDIRIEKAQSGKGLATRGTEFSLDPMSASGERGGWFSLPGVKPDHVIPAGAESKWVTVTK